MSLSDQTNRPGLSSVARKLLVVAGFAVSVILVVLYVYPRVGWFPSLLIMAAVTLMLVRAYSLGYRYRCGNCGRGFRVPLIVDLFTMSAVGKNPDGTYFNWKSLTCPHCGQVSKAVVVHSPVADPGEHDVWVGDRPDDSSAKGAGDDGASDGVAGRQSAKRGAAPAAGKRRRKGKPGGSPRR
jgi:hypothetical protein